MKELLCRMRLFSCGSEAEKGAIGQEVTGTSRHSNGRHFDEARPKTRLVGATTEIRRSRQRRRPQRCELLHDGRRRNWGVARFAPHFLFFVGRRVSQDTNGPRSSVSRAMAARRRSIPAPVRAEVAIKSGNAAGLFAIAALMISPHRARTASLVWSHFVSTIWWLTAPWLNASSMSSSPDFNPWRESTST